MLVLPNGLSSKPTINLTAEEVDWIAKAEHMCRKLQMIVACPNCLRNGNRTGATLRGANDESDPVISVTCDCKTWRFRQR